MANETASYDEKGNITEKTDVGSFEYSHPEKPYAITGVSLANKFNSVYKSGYCLYLVFPAKTNYRER